MEPSNRASGKSLRSLTPFNSSTNPQKRCRALRGEVCPTKMASVPPSGRASRTRVPTATLILLEFVLQEEIIPSNNAGIKRSRMRESFMGRLEYGAGILKVDETTRYAKELRGQGNNGHRRAEPRERLVAEVVRLQI